jgi:hypothetical protein
MTKIIAWILIILMVLNLFLLIVGKLSDIIFWIITIIIALVAYKLIPKLNNPENNNQV